MKRVLVLNADSFVGKEVCRRFYEAKEYLIDGTLYHQLSSAVDKEWYESCCDLVASSCLLTDVDSSKLAVPHDLQPFLNSVMPRHGEISDEQFRVRVLTYDIIIAVLENNAFEADCTIKVLRGTHYEVEKTFVLVSNVFTWAQTDAHEHELLLAARRAEREAARANNEYDDDDSAEATEEEEEEEEVMEMKVWSEDDYHKRHPDSRYSVWRELEHMVKHANSETLHTYVLWAGLPYGNGEDILARYFHNAWRHQKLLQYGDGSNYIPTIHVYDLSRIIFLVGSSYDTLENRYMFAVDQGNNTQEEILQGIKDFIGGVVERRSSDFDRRKRLVGIFSQKKQDDTGSTSAKFFEATGGSEPAQPEEGILRLHKRMDSEDDAASDALEKEAQLMASIAEREIVLHASLSHYSRYSDDKQLGDAAGLVVGPPHGLANWFSAVNVRCEPGAVLSLLEEDEWVSLGGFFANIDKVVLEFKKQRYLRPMRIVLSGPPCCRKKIVACKLAEIFEIPYLTLENVLSAYKEHVAKIRAEMVDIFVRRRLRRHEAREERKRRAEERAKRARAEARANEEGEEEEDEEEEEEEEEEDDEGSENDTGEEGEDEDGEEEEEDEEGDVDNNNEKKMIKKQELYATIEEKIRHAITEEELLRPPGFEEEDEEEEDWEGDGDDDYEEEDEKAALLKQKIDNSERRRIATLREEYRFATRLLTLHLVNGEFPPRPKSFDNDWDEEEEEEDEEEENNSATKERRGKKKGHTPPASTDEPPPIIRYLDEAIAVMVRWRLQQDDCRSQGYLLDSFPASVRQASLLFMAGTDEQKEMQRPKLRREREKEEGPEIPYDANFPLPKIHELDDDKRRELLDLMNGKTFLSAEEALAPTHETFFPDCFIFLTGGESFIRANLLQTLPTDEDVNTASDFYEQFTQYMTHHHPAAKPTESLPTWSQTVVIASGNNDVEDNGSEEGAAVDGSLSRKACVLFLPILVTNPLPIFSGASVEDEETRLQDYCGFIEWSILKNKGYGSSGHLLDTVRAYEEAEIARRAEVYFEWLMLEKLRSAEDMFLEVAKNIEALSLEKERRVLRFYEAREALTSVAGVDSVPADMYLRQYVLPSLTPLMAEVVRMRPEDPVTVLADALFYHKRQISL